MDEVRLFLASPGDVPFERMRAERVVARLNASFAGQVRIRLIRWEDAQYRAHRTFQAQIPEPAECDVVVAVFANKLGSELPPDFPHRLPDGAPYPSGTAYELLSALAAADRDGRPDVYVFRKTSGPTFGLGQQAEFEAARREKARLDAFFATWFRTPAGGYSRAFHHFADTDAFEVRLEALLRDRLAATLAPAPDWDAAREGSPFRGLEAFDLRHARLYFGRDRKVGRAVEELRRAGERDGGMPFLLVVGPSGSGKSSLVRAGLAPRLTAPGNVPQVDLWRIAVMRPGDPAGPVAALAQALFADGSPGTDPGGFGPALPELALGAFRDPAALASMLAAAPGSAAAPVVAALDTVGAAEAARAAFARPVRADLLLSTLALSLRDQSSVSSAALDVLLGVSETLLDRIQRSEAQDDGAIARWTHAAFATLERLLPVANAGDARALERSRARMLYEFAETYHRTANNPAEAMRKAQQSRAILQRLHDGGDRSAATRRDLAMADLLLGELLRRRAPRNAPATAPDLAMAREVLHSAETTLAALAVSAPDDAALARARSRVLTNLGDLALGRGARARDALLEALEVRSQLLKQDRSRQALFDAFAATVDALARLYRHAGDAGRAEAFAGAATELGARIPQAFRPESALPADQMQRQLQVLDMAHQRANGVFAMMHPDRGRLVEADLLEFAVARLPALRDAEAGCWPRLAARLRETPRY